MIGCGEEWIEMYSVGSENCVVRVCLRCCCGGGRFGGGWLVFGIGGLTRRGCLWEEALET